MFVVLIMNLKMNKQKLTLKSKQFHFEDLTTTESSFNTNESKDKKSINQPTPNFGKAEKIMTRCLMTLKGREMKSKPLIEKHHSLQERIEFEKDQKITKDDCCFKINRKISQKGTEENERKFKTGLCKNFETKGECVFGASVNSLVFICTWQSRIEVKAVRSLFFQDQSLQTVFRTTLLFVWWKVPVFP